MKKLLIGLLVLLVLLLAATLIGPQFVDWNEQKQRIAAAISQRIGQPVAIDGTIDFAMLPTPVLTANGVRIANPPGSMYPEMATIEALDVRVALLPLLGGRIQVERVVLVNPVAVVERRPDGGTNWSGVGAGVDWRDQRFGFDHVTIENGTLVWRSDSETPEERITRIFAQLGAPALAGPISAAGSFEIRGVALTVNLTTGRMAGGGSLPLTLALGVDGADGELRFAGLVTAAGQFQGSLSGSGGDLARMIRPVLGDRAPSVLEQPFALETTVLTGPDGVDLKALSASLGDTRATGALSIGLDEAHHVEAALTFERIALDPWLDAMSGPDGDALATLRRVSDDLVAPSQIGATLDLKAEAVELRGSLIREVVLAGSLSDGVLAVNTLSALLPGGLDLSLAGTLRDAGEQPQIELAVEAASGDLRGCLEWLGVDVAAVPTTRLRRFDGAATLTGTWGAFQIAGIDLTVDSTRATGGLAYADRGRPGIGLRLDVGELNLDSYLPPEAAGRLGPLLARWQVAEGVRRLLRSVDLNVQARIGALTLGGATIRGLELDGTATDGAIDIGQAAIGDLAGASLSLEGAAASLDPLSSLALRGEFAAADPAALLRALGGEPGPAIERLGAVSVSGHLAGDPDRLEIGLDGTAAEGSFEIGGAIADPAGRPMPELAVRVAHPNLPALLALPWPDYRPRGPIGGLDLYAHVARSAEGWTFDRLQGHLGELALAGTVTLRFDGGRPAVEAELRTSDLAVDPLLAAGGRDPAAGPAGPALGRWGDTLFDLDWLEALDLRLALNAASVELAGIRLGDAALRAALADGVLTVDGLSGTLLGGEFGASGRLAAGNGAELSLAADLVGAPVADLLGPVLGAAPLEGTADLGIDVTTTGHSWAGLVRAADGEGLLAVRDGVIHGLDLAAVGETLDAGAEPLEFLAQLRRALSEGDTPFAALNLPFTLEDGVAGADGLRLSTAVGTGTGEGRFDLARRQMDVTVAFELYDHPDAPPFGIVLAGPLDDPQRRLQIRELQAFAAERAQQALSERLSGGADPAPAPPEPAAPEPAGAAEPQDSPAGARP